MNYLQVSLTENSEREWSVIEYNVCACIPLLDTSANWPQTEWSRTNIVYEWLKGETYLYLNIAWELYPGPLNLLQFIAVVYSIRELDYNKGPLTWHCLDWHIIV